MPNKVGGGTRRFETDYAGAWRGFCKTRESAITAGMRHLVNDGYSRCTVTDRVTRGVVARLAVDGTRRRVSVTLVEPLKGAIGASLRRVK